MRCTWALLLLFSACERAPDAAPAPRDQAPGGLRRARVYRAPAPRPSPPPLTRLGKHVLAPLGTAHPTIVGPVAPDGSWVVFCQARSDTDGDGEISMEFGHHGEVLGDRMAAFVAAANVSEEPIDSVVAFGQRSVVVEMGEQVVLLDPKRDLRVALNSQLLRYSGRPVVDVDVEGRALLYIHRRGTETVVTVRDNDTGRSTDLRAGEGHIGSGFLSPDGAYAVLMVVRADSNGDGALSLGQRYSTLASGPCRGPAMSSSSGMGPGDDFIFRAIHVASGFRADYESYESLRLFVSLDRPEWPSPPEGAVAEGARGELLALSTCGLSWLGEGPLRWFRDRAELDASTSCK